MLFELSILFGVLVGFSLGLTGGGGSIFAVPLLVYGLGVAPREAIRVSLCCRRHFSCRRGAEDSFWQNKHGLTKAINTTGETIASNTMPLHGPGCFGEVFSNPLPYLVPDLPKSQKLLVIRALGRGGVLEWPVKQTGCSRQGRAALLCLVTDRHHKVKRFIVERVNAFALVLGQVDTDFSHDLHGQRVDESGRPRTCRGDAPTIATQLPPEPLGHLRPT